MPRETSMADILIILIVIHNFAQIDSAILSKNKIITSSSTYTNWVPQRALDGDSRRDGTSCRCCAATNYQPNPWYELDLGKHYTVHRIHVEGRNDEKTQHFQGMRIFLHWVRDGLNNGIQTNITDELLNFNYVLPVPTPTQFISLALYDVQRVFTICELTVYGECSDGEFGGYCEHDCHCDGNPCNKTTGVCPSGRCVPGYQGTACDKECPDGTYGPGCTESCGYCSSTDICNKQDGSCLDGCVSGFQGNICKQQCSAGFYGNDCSNECKNCVTNTTCHHIHGACIEGCKAGFKAPLCRKECDTGTYGPGCFEKCGRCYGNATCNKKNGTCLGCEQGFYGYDCKLEMKVGRLSDDGVSCNYITALAISGWVCVGIMVIVGTTIFLRIRTRFRQKSPMTATNLYEIPNNSQLEQEHQYECAVVTPPDPVYTNTDLPRDDAR